jgi:hypothetical protein
MSTLEARRTANQRFYARHKEQEKARCKKWRQDNQDWYKDWAEKNKDRRVAANRKCDHQMLPEEFDRKFQDQDGKCAICKQPLKRPDIDHDHSCCPGRKSCGKCTRGLLCRSCNTFLGLAKESPEILNNAILYVNQYKKEQ